MSILISFFLAFGFAIFVFGLQTFVFYPLSIYYEIWKRRFFKKYGEEYHPFVSVLVPAYNEEDTIRLCVESILNSDYDNFELVVIDDGSTDGTREAIQDYIEAEKLRYIWKPNSGKASALNLGIGEAKGDIILYTDADTIFLKDTIHKMVRWFISPKINAVCGNDTPIHPETALQKLLTITTHIGTGFVRRALSVLNVLPIISGNSGAVRKDVLKKIGGFTEIWGEDLDLTFKLHKAKARIVFDPDALVVSDVPRNFKILWKQRVRWMRSFIKISALHKDLFFNPRYFPFSFYLPINWVNMVIVPIFQVLAFIFLPIAMKTGYYRLGGPIDIIAYLGFGLFLIVAVYSTVLDKAFAHLKYIPVYGFLMIPVSYFYNAVLIYSIYKELRKSEEVWEKIDRRDLEAVTKKKHKTKYHPVWVTLTTIIILLIISLSATSIILHRPRTKHYVILKSESLPDMFAVATHFDSWQNPTDAINSVMKRTASEVITTVGISAGRYEWNNFKWKGHEKTWSNDQKSVKYDLLEQAIKEFNSEKKEVVAIVDFYAPKYLKEHPEDAAVGADGSISPEQVCFIELVKGNYGKKMLEMVTYLAKNYNIWGIDLTELEYNRYCYDERCLKSYKEYTGARGWPRKFFPRHINRDDESIGRWRSTLMYQFLKEMSDSVHKYGKKLFVDVPINWKHMKREGLATGLYYQWVLKAADYIVVWDYFYLEDRPPETSEEVARFFTSHYDPEKVVISIGLWGKNRRVSPEELAVAVYSSLKGGNKKLWITPNYLLSDAHWELLLKILGVVTLPAS